MLRCSRASVLLVVTLAGRTLSTLPGFCLVRAAIFVLLEVRSALLARCDLVLEPLALLDDPLLVLAAPVESGLRAQPAGLHLLLANEPGFVRAKLDRSELVADEGPTLVNAIVGSGLFPDFARDRLRPVGRLVIRAADAHGGGGRADDVAIGIVASDPAAQRAEGALHQAQRLTPAPLFRKVFVHTQARVGPQRDQAVVAGF